MQESREPQIAKFGRDLASLRNRLVRPVHDVPVPLARGGDDTLLMLEELEVAGEELRQQAEELSESQRLVEAERVRYKTLFDDAPDAYLVTDSLGMVREANRAATAMFGLPREFFLGKPLVSFVDSAARRAFRQQLDLLCGHESTAEVVLAFTPRHGSERRVAVRIVRVGVGSSIELRWILRDVTDLHRSALRIAQMNVELTERVVERTEDLTRANAEKDALLESERRARADAEQASRIKSEFLAVLSHEFRTPLQALFGYAELLDSGVHGSLEPAQREDVRRIQLGLTHMASLVNQILDRASLDAGRLSLDIRLVPLDEALESLRALMEAQLATKGISLEIAPAGPPLAARADAEKLRQVLVNLLANAAKYTPSGGHVAIECSATGETVTIAVRDSGIGIPAGKIDAIFAPYVRLHQNDRPSLSSGLGLGLAISRDLVAAMDGSLTAESVVGVGSTFRITLPRAIVGSRVERSA